MANEKRLIDANALIAEYDRVYIGEPGKARKLMEDAPTIDAVEVVRCQQCKHHYWEQEPCHGKTVHYCKLPHMIGVEVFKEFFCSCGERKEGVD